MRILSIELYDIKSYEHARLEFTEGINAIVGLNGAGKSTILEAIGFALFNSMDYTQAAFVRQDAGTGRVVVTFESSKDGRTYQVDRGLGTGATQSIYDPELTAHIVTGAADVPRFLREHMGVTPGTDLAQLFRDAVGVPQGTMTSAFFLIPSKRKDVFDPLLRVDEYQTAYEKLREPNSLIGKSIGEAEVAIARLEGALQQLPSLQRRAGEVAAELESVAAELAGGRADLARVAAQKEALEAEKEQISALERAREDARSALTQRQVALQTASNLLVEAEQAHAFVLQNKAGHDRYREAQRCKAELDEREKQRQALLRDQATEAVRAESARRSLATAAAEMAEIDKAAAALDALAPRVQEQETLEKERTGLQERSVLLRGVLQQRDQLARTLAQEKQRLETMRTQLRAQAALEGRLDAIETERRTRTAEQEGLAETFAEVKARGIRLSDQSKELANAAGKVLCPVCEQPLAPGQVESMRRRNETEIVALREEFSRIQRQNQALQEALKQLDERKADTDRKLRQLPAASAVAELEARTVELTTQHAAAQTEAQALEGAPAALSALDARLRALDNPRQERERLRLVIARRASVQQSRDQAAQEADAAAARLLTIEEALRAHAGLDAELEHVARELQAHKAAYEAVLSHQRSAEARDERQAAVAAAQAEVSHAEAHFAEADAAAAQAAAGFDAAAYAFAGAELPRLQHLVGGLESRQESLTKEQATLRTQIASMDEQAQALRAEQEKKRTLAAQEKVLDKLRSVIRSAGPLITEALIRQISDHAAQIFSELTGDFARRLRWNSDYSIALEVDGRDREFKALSGGEQMTAALAVRLALLREMSAIDVAFFDEPTAHLDAQRREALAGQITAIKGFRQIFVISHDDTFERATHNLVHIQRVDGLSQLATHDL